MIPLDSPELKHIAKLLRKYDLKSAISQLGGLLTVPSLHANTLRIETLVHMVVAYCQGCQKPRRTEIVQWLNRQFEKTMIPALEDPVEDVFVSNVETPQGNYRVFEGIWESNDYFVQVVLDTLHSRRSPQECRDLLLPAIALLKLSDCAAERVGLQRWHIESSTPKGAVKLPPSNQVRAYARAVTFTDSELHMLGIGREVLLRSSARVSVN